MRRVAWRSGLTAVVAGGLMAMLVLAPLANAVQDPAGCNANSVSIAISALKSGVPTNGPVKPGDVIVYQVTLGIGPVAPGELACNYEGGQLSITLPNGTLVQMAGFGGATPNVPMISDGSPFTVLSPVPYTVNVADEQLISGTKYVVCVADYGSTASHPSQINGTFKSGVDEEQTASATTSKQLRVSHPSIEVTKTCTDGTCEQGVIAFSGTVTNTGDETLVNVTVVDDQGTPGDTSDDVTVLAPTTLAAAASATFSGTYLATTTPSTDVVTATGTGQTTASAVTDTDDATCELLGSPDIAVTKECQDATSLTGPITFDGTVTNTGDVTLDSVTVVDDNGTPGDTSDDVTVLGPISLAPAASATFSGSYVPAASPSTDTVVARGTDNSICGDGRTVQATASATCGVPEQRLGCRITAGGITPDGGVDETVFADLVKATFGGQVGAPCGCIGCFDEFDNIQGSWQHTRHHHKGNFHAMLYNSLICGCDGVMDGNLCNPGDRDLGPEPRKAPANLACFSGVGELAPNNGRRTVLVAFRVEVEDRGEPGAGANAAPTDDVYRIRIWVPQADETVEALADDACCTHGEPVGSAARSPDIDDGGSIVHGNIQIHPMLPNTVKGICPPPDTACPQ